MKINGFALSNFRCFETLTLILHPNLTVFVSENGGGKTAILEAMAILLSRIATKLIRKDGKVLSQDDIYINENNKIEDLCGIILAANVDQSAFIMSSIKKRDISVKKKVDQSNFDQIMKFQEKDLRDFDDYITELLKFSQENERYEVPLIRYYGTNRVFLEGFSRRRYKQKTLTRFAALEGAFGSTSNFRAIYERFDYLERFEYISQKEKRDFDYELPDLKVVREAIEKLVPGFKNPRTKFKPIQFVVDQYLNDKIRTLKISQLSDGFRSMLALVMDLSLRMAQANPHSETGKNPLDIEAIVIIDEIDLHLHPIWQQNVLSDLRRIFPNTQFIVSTHSPQVISSVEAECIRVISDGKVFTPTGTEGAEASRILKRIFKTQLRPPNNEATKELNRYLDLVYKGEWNIQEALDLRKKLESRYNGEEDSLTEADLYIENQLWEQSNEKS